MKLSVIVTSAGRPKLLREALRSLTEQTAEDFEVIVIDDLMRRESTREVIVEGGLDLMNRKISFMVLALSGPPGASIPRSSGIENPQFYERIIEPPEGEHKRVALAINAGTEAASGEWISYLCDDDLFLPTRCEAYLEEAKPEDDILVGGALFMDAFGDLKPQEEWVYTYPARLDLLPEHRELLTSIRPSNFICHDSIMIRRTALEGRSWPTDVKDIPNDWRFWLSLKRAGLKFRKLGFHLEEAVFPGTWRSGETEDHILELRTRRTKMSAAKNKIIYAINSSGTRQNVPGRSTPIMPNERVNSDLVSYIDVHGNPVLFPGFSISGEYALPALKTPTKPAPESSPETKGPADAVDAEGADEAPAPPQSFEPIATLEKPLFDGLSKREPKHPFDVD